LPQLKDEIAVKGRAGKSSERLKGIFFFCFTLYIRGELMMQNIGLQRGQTA